MAVGVLAPPQSLQKPVAVQEPVTKQEHAIAPTVAAPTSTTVQERPTYVNLGEEGFIVASTTVGVTKDNYDAYFKTLTANDAIGYYQLKESGVIYDLTTKTKALVIDRSWGYDEVRFLDGPHFGKTAWVQYEVVLNK